MKEYRVYWIPKLERGPFLFQVDGVDDAAGVLMLLSKYDMYLNTLVDIVSVGGLQVRELKSENEWEEWCDEDGKDIWKYLSKNCDWDRTQWSKK